MSHSVNEFLNWNVFRTLRLLIILLAPAVAVGQPRIRLYTVKDGLSQNSVTALFRDRDGYLWVGTQDGLNRFDGYAFTQYRHDPGDPRSLSDQYVTAIEQDKDGKLWVGTRNGLSLFNRSTNDFTRIYPDPAQKNFIQNPTYKIGSLPDGDLLVAISGRIFRRNHVDETFTPLQENQQFNANITVAGDTVWQIWSSNHACRLLPVREHQHPGSKVLGVPGWKVFGQQYDGRSTIWSYEGTAPGVTKLTKFNIRTRLWEPGSEMIPATVNQIIFTNNGEPWLGTTRGIFRRNLGRSFEQWNPEGVQPGSKVLSMHVSEDGLIWIGFANNGLARYNPDDRVFRNFRIGVNDPVFAAYECQDGRILMAAQSGLYRSDSIGEHKERLLPFKVTSVFEDGTRNIWAGTEASGVFLLSPMGKVLRNFRMNSTALPSNNIFHLAGDQESGRIFISTESGMAVADTWGIREIFDGSDSTRLNRRLNGNYIIHTHTDHNGHTWVSSNTGINVFDRSLDQVYSLHSGADTCRHIKRTIITGVFADRKGRHWISTLSGGVYRKTGDQFENFRSADGLSSDIAYGVVTDHRDRAWVATTKGISLIDPAGTITRLTEDDGLPATDFSLGGISIGKSGRIYIGSQQGLIIADPTKLNRQEYQPVVHLDVAQINYEQVPLMDSYDLEPNAAALGFRFSAPVFINAGSVIYQYRMAGLVDKWVSLTADDRMVNFTNLPYTGLVLELRAALSASGLSRAPVTRIRIDRAPPLWRNPWVYSPIAAGLLLLVVLFVRRREQRKLELAMRKAELDRTLSAERERLSRDLHDRLGAYAAAIKSNITQLERSDHLVQAPLDRLKSNAEEMVTALRETIWALQQDQVPVTAIGDRLKSYVNRIAPNFPDVRIQVRDLLKHEPTLTPGAAIHLMGIIQEALTNALRHSGCSLVEILFTGDKGFVITIHDNGSGFTPDADRTGYGLQNMRQRALESGFLLDISGKDGGTMVTVKYEAPVA